MSFIGPAGDKKGPRAGSHQRSLPGGSCNQFVQFNPFVQFVPFEQRVLPSTVRFLRQSFQSEASGLRADSTAEGSAHPSCRRRRRPSASGHSAHRCSAQAAAHRRGKGRTVSSMPMRPDPAFSSHAAGSPAVLLSSAVKSRPLPRRFVTDAHRTPVRFPHS